MSADWRVIADGELAVSAADAIEAIAADFERLDPSHLAHESHDVALYFAYKAMATASERSSELADAWIDVAINEATCVELHPALHGGLTGIAWTVEHLQAMRDPASDDDPNADIDELLREFTRETPWPGDYDVVSGLVGFGVYLLERAPRAIACDGLVQIVDRLAELSEYGCPGRCWLTPSDRVPEAQRQWAPQGYYNLGVAHGVPGVIGMLSHCVVRGIAVPQSAELLAGAVEWLLAQEAREAEERFPNWLPVGSSRRNASRLAWCYGDLGVALVLMNAGVAMHEAAWIARAVDIGVSCLHRSPALARVRDGGLCHGASGLVHIFNRLFQATGDERFRNGACHWLCELLTLRGTRGHGGFLTLRGTPNGTPAPSSWVTDVSFLTGSAGIGLALMAATMPLRPDWDRLLLASLPVPALATAAFVTTS